MVYRNILQLKFYIKTYTGILQEHNKCDVALTANYTLQHQLSHTEKIFPNIK